MSSLRTRPLLNAAGLCFAAAVLGNVFVLDAYGTWFQSLAKPAFLVRDSVFYAVAVLYYLIFGTILYRVLTRVQPPQGRRMALFATILVLGLNELWSVAFFGSRNALVGFVGMLVFAAALAYLIRILWRRERFSAFLLLPYAAWVAYDVVWTFALWRLNP